MIDTHAHIRPGDEVKIEGLEWVVLSASGVEDSKSNIELAKLNSNLLPSIGIHPQEQLIVISEQLTEIEELLKENNMIVAVGECGLDFSGDFDKKHQEELLRGQIKLAIKYNKPLIIHSRKAMDETLEILNSYKNLRGVIHCYSGGKKRIKKVLQSRIDNHNDIYFGIDGNLTYEEGLQEVVREIPKDRLVLETDSPELTPIPFRALKNYPEYVKYVYEKVSEIWDQSFEETEKQIDGNAGRLF